jgi:hypothetical protein
VIERVKLFQLIRVAKTTRRCWAAQAKYGHPTYGPNSAATLVPTRRAQSSPLFARLEDRSRAIEEYAIIRSVLHWQRAEYR